jgi:cell division protein FtsB
MEKLNKVNFKLFFLALLCLLMALSLFRNLTKIQGVKKRIENAKIRAEALKAENQRLVEELRKVQSESFLEKEMRDKLGLAKEGEVVVVLPEPEVLRKLSPQIPEEEEVLPLPPWQQWLNLFK